MDFDDNKNDVCKQDDDLDINEDESVDVQNDPGVTDCSEPTEAKVEKKKISKKTKNIIISVAIIVSAIGISLVLSKDVIRTTFKIGTLGNIDVNSYSKLTEANSYYEELNKFEKSIVINHEQLEIANQKYSDAWCEYINEKINEYTKNITVEYYDKLTTLQYSYEKLSNEEKSKIKNVEALNSAVKKVKKLKAIEVVEEIKDMSNYDSSSAMHELKWNSDILTKEQIEECLVEIGRWEAVDEADEYIKGFLKSPKSYNRYESYHSEAEKVDNGLYFVKIKIKYGATNSFNAEITNDVGVLVEYMVDIDNFSITYVFTNFASYESSGDTIISGVMEYDINS